MNFAQVVVLVASMLGITGYFLHRSRIRASNGSGNREGELKRVVFNGRLSHTERMFRDANLPVMSFRIDDDSLQEEITSEFFKLRTSLFEARVFAREPSNHSGQPAQTKVPVRLIDGAVEILDLKW